MKITNFILFVLFSCSVSSSGIFSMEREEDDVGSLRLKIPERPPVPRKKITCCGLIRLNNSDFKKDAALVEALVRALKITNPETLQVVLAMCHGRIVMATPEKMLLVKQQLTGLGLLDLEGNLKEDWVPLIREKCANINLEGPQLALNPAGLPPQYDTSCARFLTCQGNINDLFMKGLDSLCEVLTALSITSPASLRQLILKSRNPLYELSPEIHEQLERLGFLEFDAESRLIQVRRVWLMPVMSMVVPPDEALAQEKIFETCVEDLVWRYPEYAQIILHVPASIDRRLAQLVYTQYGLFDVDPSGSITVTHDRVKKIQEAIAKVSVDPFVTSVRLSDIYNVLFDYYHIVA